MLVYGIDPDDYSKYKLPAYVARNYTVEELITMGSKSIKNKYMMK